jgi:hypothetical protein
MSCDVVYLILFHSDSAEYVWASLHVERIAYNLMEGFPCAEHNSSSVFLRVHFLFLIPFIYVSRNELNAKEIKKIFDHINTEFRCSVDVKNIK